METATSAVLRGDHGRRGRTDPSAVRAVRCETDVPPRARGRERPRVRRDLPGARSDVRARHASPSFFERSCVGGARGRACGAHLPDRCLHPGLRASAPVLPREPSPHRLDVDRDPRVAGLPRRRERDAARRRFFSISLSFKSNRQSRVPQACCPESSGAAAGRARRVVASNTAKRQR